MHCLLIPEPEYPGGQIQVYNPVPVPHMHLASAEQQFSFFELHNLLHSCWGTFWNSPDLRSKDK